jgi:hypothetical protein
MNVETGVFERLTSIKKVLGKIITTTTEKLKQEKNK